MTVDVHTHFIPDRLMAALRARRAPPWVEATPDGSERIHMPLGSLALSGDYWDMEKRLAFMDAHGIERQMLSFPGLFGLDSLPARECGPLLSGFNDDAAALVRAHPDRFAGLAALPFADMDAAVAEYRRGRTELGLAGAILPNNAFLTRGHADRLRPLFNAAEELGGHLFIHPGRRPDEVPPAGTEAAAPFADSFAARQALGVQNAVGHCMVTLLFTDFLDRYDRVTVHVANLGGTLPMVIERMDQVAVTRTPGAPLPSDRARRIHVDISSLGPKSIRIAADVYGADKLLFGTDCPIFSTRWSLDAVAASGLSAEAREGILSRNAEEMLGRG
jgi:predicted TIM-barrel fold metal-dependent hydrolase